MKKIYSFAIFLLCFHLLPKAQTRIAYYDAVFIDSVFKAVHGKIDLNDIKIKNFLNQYFNARDTAGAVPKLVSENPFLSLYFTTEGPKSVGDIETPKNFIGQLGNLDVTTFVDGLAKFLVARSKEELNVAFFRKFQDWLTLHPEAQIYSRQPQVLFIPWLPIITPPFYPHSEQLFKKT